MPRTRSGFEYVNPVLKVAMASYGLQKETNLATVADSASGITAAEFLSGAIDVSGGGADTLTLPTGAELAGAMLEEVSRTTRQGECIITNNSGGLLTLAPGATGCTLTSTNEYLIIGIGDVALVQWYFSSATAYFAQLLARPAYPAITTEVLSDNRVLTAAELLTGHIELDAGGSARTVTVPAPAAIVAAVPNCFVGYRSPPIAINNISTLDQTAETLTMTASGSSTISTPLAIIYPNDTTAAAITTGSSTWVFIVSNVTSSSEAVAFHRIA